MLNICFNVIDFNARVGSLIALGGFSALHSALESLITRGLSEFNKTGHLSYQLTSAIGINLFAVSNYQGGAAHQLTETEAPSIDKTQYYFTVEGAQQYTLCLNNAYDMLPDGPARRGILYNVVSAYMYELRSKLIGIYSAFYNRRWS